MEEHSRQHDCGKNWIDKFRRGWIWVVVSLLVDIFCLFMEMLGCEKTQQNMEKVTGKKVG